MSFVYEIQAYAYSDFESHILLHEKLFTAEEFMEMIEICRVKSKEIINNKWKIKFGYYYPNLVIKFLVEDFNFKFSEHLIAYVGCSYEDSVEVELNENLK